MAATRTLRRVSRIFSEYESSYSKVEQRSITMTTTTKLYGKDLSAYDEMDIDELLTQLSSEEIEQLSKEVDPDDSLLPADQRCKDQTSRESTGPLNRKQLLQFLEKMAREQEDWPERLPFQTGVVRGKVWKPRDIPKPPPEEEEIALDVGDEYERALTDASEEDLVDLAAILGLHSMMNQDQYYTSVTNKKKKFGMKFDSIVKGSQPRALPFEPDNSTDVEKTVVQIDNNDPSLKSLNWNNIKSVSLEKFTRLFAGLKKNTHLESLSLANTWMTDPAARVLCSALEENRSLKVLNVESNYISPPVVKDLVKSLLGTQTVEEFRATNQKPEVLGVKIEMEIAKMVEENKNLRRLGLSFDIPDARIRVHRHLQKNNDSLRLKRIGSES